MIYEYNYSRMIFLILIAYSLFIFGFYLNKKQVQSWIIRKYLHVVGLITAGIVGAFSPNLEELMVTVGILITSVIGLSLKENGFIQQIVKMASRENEDDKIAILNGVLTNLTLVVLVIIFFDQKWIFLSSTFCVGLGDGLGEFIGRPYGKHKYNFVSDKSIEGTFAVLFGSVVGGIIALSAFNQLTTYALYIIILASVIATLIEAFSIYFIDNVFMQISYALILWTFLG